MRSRTYNAIITKSYETLSKLFFPKNRERISLDTFLKDHKGQDILSLGPGGGNGFLEMDINFPTNKKSRYLSLRLVDTKEISDFFVIDRHPTDGEVLDRIENSDIVNSNENLDSVIARGSRFYFSYGVGGDVRTWSGPYTMTLSDAKIIINTDGVKEITLLFTPSLESIRSFTELLTEDKKYGQLESRFDSKKIKFDKLTIQSNIIFPTEGSGKRIPKPGYEETYRNKDGVNVKVRPKWNYWVRALLTQYIANLFPSIPVKNILVLFSTDLDKEAQSGGLIKLNDYGLKSMMAHQENLSKLGISITPVDENRPALPVDNTKSIITRNITKEESAVIDRNDEDLIDNYGIDPSRVLSIEDTLRNVPLTASEAIEAEEALAQQQDKTRGEILESLYSTEGIPNENKVGNQLHINPDKSAQEDKDIAGEAAKFKLGMSQTWDFKKDTSPRFNTLLEPLYKFYRGIRSTREDNIKFTLFEENDSKILEFLYNNEIIVNPRKPVIIFGENEIIQKLIYPKTPLVNNPKPQLAEFGLGSALTFLREKDFKKYSESFFNDFYTLRNKTSSFKEQVDFGPFGKSLSDKFENNDLIFMHNVKNSNVLEVSFSNSAYLRTLLLLAADSEEQLQANNAAQGEVLKENQVTNEKIIRYIRKKVGGDPEAPTSVSREKLIYMLKTDETLVNLVYEANQENIKVVPWLDVIGFLVEFDKLPGPGPKIVSSKNRAKDYSDMLEDLNRFTVTAKVKTLPFFNHPQLYDRRCFLFGLQNNIIGSVLSGKNNYTIYTGRYQILGVRHFLSNEDAFSEFELVRDDLVQRDGEVVDSLRMHTLGDIMKELPPPEPTAEEYRGYDPPRDRTLLDILTGKRPDGISLPPLEEREIPEIR